MSRMHEGNVPLIGGQQQQQQEINLPAVPKGWVVKVSVPGVATQYFCEIVHPGAMTIIPDAFSHDASRSDMVMRHRNMFLLQVPIIIEAVPPPPWWNRRMLNNVDEEES